ncbi:HEAT repeat domain-containing protein [Synechococcus sp. ATX 2A4]|uniref:HEAT repeat domain-containing protein n=1 Tax=Synechococcus sp. ATX 2A4 TaxID=2823727 RepID=UPI0028F449D4|nr:HEAT repeat domain-containing protein [Synechococcus sp. ATX 2A4]
MAPSSSQGLLSMTPATSASALDQLFVDLAHPNPYVQTEAFLAMVRHHSEASLPRLILLLDHEDVVRRRAAVRALGAFGEPAMLPLAQKFQSSRDGTVRASCVKAYAQIASNLPGLQFPSEAMAVLKTALDDESPVVAIAAVMALGQVGEQALPLLIQVCRGSNEAQAVAAVNALVNIDHPDVSICLAQLAACEDTDAYVLESVTSALVRVDDLRGRQPSLLSS